MPAQPMSSALLKDRAYEAIKNKILDGTYGPGTFLSERTQAEELGMSKTPVRAALERLTDQGLVTTSQQRGVFVKELSASEIADLYEFRTALEAYTVERLSSRSLGGAKVSIEENLRSQADAVAVGDPRLFIALDIEFHLGLARAEGNAIVISAMEQQTARLQRAVTRILTEEPRLLSRSLGDHRLIVDDIERADGKQAALHMKTHLADSKRFLLLGEMPDLIQP